MEKLNARLFAVAPYIVSIALGILAWLLICTAVTPAGFMNF